MMKKITAVLCAALFACASQVLFAAPKPSLDGRAVVADAGVLPKGAFGKSIGYLPGDSVTVTNPAAGVSIDVMILGVIDSTEGVAILLSPEAAESLFISKDSQTLVTVTKKGAFANMPESAESRMAKTDPDKDALVAIPEDISRKFEQTPVTTEPAPLLPSQTQPATTQPPAPPPAKTPVSDRAATELGENYDWIWDKELASVPQTAIYDEPQPEIVPIDPWDIAETKPQPEEPARTVPATGGEPALTESLVAEPAVAEPTTKPTETAKTTEPEKPSSEQAQAAEPEKPSSEQAKAAGPEESDFFTESIVLLIPSDPKPPAPSGKPQPDKPPATPTDTEQQIVLSPVPAQNDGISAPPANAASVPTSVKRIQSLERGKYYVQIATFSNAESVSAVAMKYGEKYPLVQIVNDMSKSSQVLVGPLTVDEYGMVLAHFREYGYKDAFLRAGK
jgi:hypothetical protein